LLAWAPLGFGSAGVGLSGILKTLDGSEPQLTDSVNKRVCRRSYQSKMIVCTQRSPNEEASDDSDTIVDGLQRHSGPVFLLSSQLQWQWQAVDHLITRLGWTLDFCLYLLRVAATAFATHSTSLIPVGPATVPGVPVPRHVAVCWTCASQNH
jgi:hypothetical protein